jgi:hypothetical protein
MIADLYLNWKARDLAMKLSRPYRGFHGDIIDQVVTDAFHEVIQEQHSQHQEVSGSTPQEHEQ